MTITKPILMSYCQQDDLSFVMQATLDATTLKSFVKALTCLSKYGDELTIYASSDSLSLSATNSSKSAYCRLKYDKHFFAKYKIMPLKQTSSEQADEFDDTLSVTGQLLTKSLLSILKHRTIEKAVERCHLSILEGPLQEDVAEVHANDGLASKLIIRLQCKHGVIKTHRLALLTPTSIMAPGVPEGTNESNLTISPKSLKDMIEHFPVAKGPKSDPQLIWTFRDSEVELKSLESVIDAKGKVQLVTELTIAAAEFDVYNIYATPTTIGFHLREFNATVAYADSMSLPLDLRFTDPAAPLFIDLEGDHIETLFVISTSQVHGVAPEVPTHHYYPDANSKKREREDTPAETINKKSAKAAQRVEPQLRSIPPPPGRGRPYRMLDLPVQTERESMPPPSTSFIPEQHSIPQSPQQEPLFLKSSSPLSVPDGAVIQSARLAAKGIDVEGKGEVALDLMTQDSQYHIFLERPQNTVMETDSLEIAQEETELPPTQNSSGSKMFQALFED